MEMNKNSKKILAKADIITGLLCLVGIIPGLACYNRLPDQMPIHFNINNQPDNYMSKNIVIFALPLSMMIFHLICCIIENLNIPYSATPRPVKWIVRIIIPAITISLQCVTVMFTLDIMTDIGLVCNLIVGVIYILLGNYLPKTRPNLTFGIKLPWTLTNEEVWSKTHRLAGWLMVPCGIIVIAASFLKAYIIWTAALFIPMIIPVVYSFVISRKQNTDPSK